MNIFNIFNHNSKYMCPLLFNHLHFSSRNALEPCCSANIGPALVNNLSDKSSILSFINAKKHLINLFKSGIIPDECKNCVHIAPFNPPLNLKINKITLNHYTQCNCACIYCTQGNRSIQKIKEDENKPVLYNVLTFINELYDHELIDTHNLYIDFQGGNISCLHNYQEIINTFLSRGVGTIYIPTNNIVYMPVIENLLVSKKGELCTALDSGSKETYLKIKQVDKFDISVQNLKKYIAKAGNDSIIVKYIIVSGFNDNIDEVTKFMKLMIDINIKIIVIDIDYRNIIDTSFVIPKHYYDIVNFVKSTCQQFNMNFAIPPYTKSILDKGFSLK